MATNLLGRAEREARESVRDQLREQVRRLARFAAASTVLAAVIQLLLDALAVDDAVTLAELWRQVEQVVSRHDSQDTVTAVTAALTTLVELAPPPNADEDADAAWRAVLVKRYGTVRPFLPLLTDVIHFGAVEGGQPILGAVQRLPALLAHKQIRREDVSADGAGAAEVITGSWKRFVYVTPPREPQERRVPAVDSEGPGRAAAGRRCSAPRSRSRRGRR